MNSTLHRYATPLITGFFLISLISGVALFFHFGSGTFREMHEWLSMVLLVPFILHIWRNWHAMTVYFRKPAFVGTMMASLVAALAFAIPASISGSAGGPPQLRVLTTMLSHTPAEVAPALGLSPEKLVEQLKSAGFAAVDLQTPLADVAAKAGKDTFELAGALLPATP